MYPFSHPHTVDTAVPLRGEFFPTREFSKEMPEMSVGMLKALQLDFFSSGQAGCCGILNLRKEILTAVCLHGAGPLNGTFYLLYSVPSAEGFTDYGNRGIDFCHQ